jgi:hypothetical protein
MRLWDGCIWRSILLRSVSNIPAFICIIKRYAVKAYGEMKVQLSYFSQFFHLYLNSWKSVSSVQRLGYVLDDRDPISDKGKIFSLRSIQTKSKPGSG